MEQEYSYYESLKEMFDNHADNLDRSYLTNPDKIERFELWSSYIEKYSKLINATSCLDIGCGSGIFSIFAAKLGMNVIGIDISDEMLRLCEYKRDRSKISNVSFLNANVSDISSLTISKFDLIICSSVLEYIRNVNITIDKINSVLRSNGIALVSLPNKSSIYRKYSKIKHLMGRGPQYMNYLQNSFKVGDAIDLFKKSGFDIIDYKYYGMEIFREFTILQKNINERYFKNLILFVLQKV